MFLARRWELAYRVSPLRLACSETVHGAAKRMAELEEAVRRMVLEGLGVAEHHEPLGESTWHLLRMWEYDAGEKKIRHPGSPGPHQDTNALSIVCQHEVAGLEVRTKGGEWIRVEPSPASLVVIVGNALRVRLAAPPLGFLPRFILQGTFAIQIVRASVVIAH
jgi:hypothetical protein